MAIVVVTSLTTARRSHCAVLRPPVAALLGRGDIKGETSGGDRVPRTPPPPPHSLQHLFNSSAQLELDHLSLRMCAFHASFRGGLLPGRR